MGLQIPAFTRRRQQRAMPPITALPLDVVPFRGIWLEEGQLRVKWTTGDPEFHALRNMIRAIPGREWHPENIHWSVPVTPRAAAALLEISRRYGFKVRPRAQEAMETAGAAALERGEASRALVADDVDVPGLVGTLRPFQAAGVRYALDVERCFIADEVGLGKTWEGFATVQAADAYPCIVVCPAKMRRVWRRELEQHLPGRSVGTVKGLKPNADEVYEADYVLVGQDVLHAHVERLAAIKPQAIVVDEAHGFKTPRARRTGALLELAARTRPRVRLCLTGTPLPNRPMELLPQLQFLDRVADMGGEKDFTWRYDRSYIVDYEMLRLHEMLRQTCYVRRLKRDVWPELPPVQVTAVEADVAQSQDYDDAVAELMGAAEGYRDAAAGQQASYRGAAMGALSQMRSAVGAAKIPAAVEWTREFLAAGGEKLIVFAHHIPVQEALAAAFPGCARIKAGMTDDAAMDEVDRFQTDPACHVIVVSLMAGGQGLTMTAASHMLIVEYPWVPKDLQQAHGRAHGRVSDAHGLNAYHLTAPDTIDDMVVEILERKLRVTTAVADGELLDEAETTRSIMGEILDVYLHGKAA